jgi:hypothetical protein
LTPAELNARSGAAFAARRAAKAAAEAAARIAEAVATANENGTAPVFNPERLALQQYGPGGLCYIQQTHRFTAAGKYLGEVPPEQAYITTEEMERNNERDRARWRAKSRQVGPTLRREPVPEALMKAAQENAVALSAERLAE